MDLDLARIALASLESRENQIAYIFKRIRPEKKLFLGFDG